MPQLHSVPSAAPSCALGLAPVDQILSRRQSSLSSLLRHQRAQCLVPGPLPMVLVLIVTIPCTVIANSLLLLAC